MDTLGYHFDVLGSLRASRMFTGAQSYYSNALII